MALNRHKRPNSSDDHEPAKKPRFDAIYLEDYTPVRTIEIKNVPEDTNPEYLRGYFEHASGPVDNVKLVQEPTSGEMNAFITFTIPEDAARLICDSNLNFSIKFTVNEADSIHQPKIDPNTLKLEEINDDCLLEIMKYLDLVDVVNLGKTSLRLNSVTEQSYKKYKHFSFGANTGDSLTNEFILPTILPAIGSHIRSLEIYNMNANMLDALAQHCPKIKTLKIINSCRSLSFKIFKKNKLFFKELKILEITNGTFFDNSVLEICKVSELTHLTLNKCRNIRGTFISRLKKLKTLKVFGCQNVCPSDICKCRSISKLTAFATDCCGCSYIHFLENAENMHNIKDLEFDASSFSGAGDILHLENIKFLTKLTKLKVNRNYTRNKFVPSEFANFDNFLLALSQLERLESLEIAAIEMNDATLQNLNKFKNLKHLTLVKMQNRIGNRFYNPLHHLLPNLKELTIRKMYINTSEFQSISKMIIAHENLECFSHSGISVPLLEIILKDVQQAKQSAIKIGIPEFIFDNPSMELREKVLLTKKVRHKYDMKKADKSFFSFS